MTILQIIQRDIDLTKEQIKKLSSSTQVTLEELDARVTRLKEILKSGFVPPSYTSIIDNRTYYASADGLHLRQSSGNNIRNLPLFFNFSRLGAKEVIKRKPLTKTESSFYMLVGGFMGVFTVGLLNKTRLSSSFSFISAQVILGFGATALGGYILFKTKTAEDIGKDMHIRGKGNLLSYRGQ